MGTRDRDEAISRLKALDLHMAIKLGWPTRGRQAGRDHQHRRRLAGLHGLLRPQPRPGRRVTRDAEAVPGGPRQAHQVLRQHGITTWNEFDKAALERYGNWLSRKRRSHRTVYFELTLLKSVNGWLIENKKLPADAKIVYPLSKPQGTDTYCYTREEVAAMVKHCQANPKLGWLAQRDHRPGSPGRPDRRTGRLAVDRRGPGDQRGHRGRRAGQPPQEAGRDRPDDQGEAVSQDPDSPPSAGVADEDAAGRRRLGVSRRTRRPALRPTTCCTCSSAT